MRFFYDNVVTIQVALVCAALAWIFGGTVSSSLLPTVPWLLVILFEVLLCFPQRHIGETTYQARARVWRRLGRDPLTWVVMAFLVMLIIPFFNKGLCPSCDYPLIAFEGESEQPPVAFIPYCINRREHLSVVMWFVPALMVMLAVKHALLKRGKRTFLELIVWNGLALSAVGILQMMTKAPGPLWCDPIGGKAYFFSTFGYPNMAGDYFTTLFGLAIGLWRWKVEEERKEAVSRGGSASHGGYKAFCRKHHLLIPALVFFFSALMTLSRAAILAVFALAILFFAHTFATFVKRMKKVQRAKATAVTVVVSVLVLTLFFIFMSDRTRSSIREGQGRDTAEAAPMSETVENATKPLESAEAKPTAESGFESILNDTVDSLLDKLPKASPEFKRELGNIGLLEAVDRMAGGQQYHCAVAFRVWKEHPFFGCGGWGYGHLCAAKMTDSEYAKMQDVGGDNVHNDYLQFLAEHGAVGLGLLVAIVFMLISPIGPIWRALVSAVRFTKPKDQPPKPFAIFVLPAPVFCILLTSLSTMLHALGDCPFRSPAILTLFFASLAAMDGFLPHVKNQRD